MKPLNTGEVLAALRGRYSGSAWAFLTEVPNGTGFAGTRSADGIAMSLWPSRGLELHGIEIKVSRSDWLRELKDPGKADDFFNYCDRWWVAVGDPAIVKDGELPPNWGLLIPRGKSLFQKVEAGKLSPIPPDRCFLAALMRRACEQLVPKCEITERLNQAREEGREEERRNVRFNAQELVELQKAVKDFETASGIRLSHWDAGKVGELVRKLRNLPHRQDIRSDIERQLRQAEGTANGLKAMLKELDEVAAVMTAAKEAHA